jgi:outer membrane protein assembly factor BamB
MNSETSPQESVGKPLRIWPALILMVAMVLCRFVPGFIEGANNQYWYIPVFFPALGSLLLLLWWLAGSRATGREKYLCFLGFIVSTVLIIQVSHATMQGPVTSYLTVPLGMLAFGLAAYFNRSKAPNIRVSKILLWPLIAMSITMLLRNDGINGNYAFDLKLRWPSATVDGAWTSDQPTPPAKPDPKIDTALTNAEWPGFRGADRMGRSKAPKLATDWTATPPKLLWKKPVGAGWSSFAVATPFVFTQEQRAAKEVVACYDLDSGEEVWIQEREARFDEPMGGPGPRSTPTLADGAVFTVSASGMLQRLKANSGEVVWQQDFKSIAEREPPMWGYSSSPLVTHSLVIVYAGGSSDKGIIAFDSATGKQRWSAACGSDSYSSPQLSMVLGQELVLMLTNEGLHMLDPETGVVRFNYTWKIKGYRALQPTVIGDDVVLLPTTMSEGTRAIRITRKEDALVSEDLWTSKDMKTDFTELIAHNGFVYGIDGSLFSCIDLKTGARVWKSGRYGKGASLLLESTNHILIAAENGRVALLEANPTAHRELTSFLAIKGKTWNHPVLVGDKLLVRNGSEAACYVLPLIP